MPAAAFSNTIWCSVVIEDSLLCSAYTVPACQTGFYYERQRGREHLKQQQQQLQYYSGFCYFLALCVCLWENASDCLRVRFVFVLFFLFFCHLFLLFLGEIRQCLSVLLQEKQAALIGFKLELQVLPMIFIFFKCLSSIPYNI